jgi:TonB-linked SusC/RagA family outer membrane protein
MYFSSVSRFPAYFPAWVLQQVPDTDYPDATGSRLADALGDWAGNPYTQMNSGGFTQDTQSTLNTDLILTQKLNFILKGLSFKGSLSLSTNYSNQSLTSSYTLPVYYIIWNRVGVDANGDGKVDQNPWFRVGQGNETYTLPLLNIDVGNLSGGYYRNLYYELSLNYSNTFFKNHNVSALALMNRQQRNSSTDFPYYNEAWVGRLTYDYLHKYLVEINIGYTGSAEFAPSNRFGFFPSGALGWVVSDEPFFVNAVPWMSKLKFRYSDGLVGSDLASSRWLYKSDYALSSGYIMEAAGANTSASWEEARKRDFGIEAGLFHNLFTFSVDLFDEHRDKMLLTPQSVTFMVGNSFKDLNLGSLKKHGMEVEFEFNKTTLRKLNYFVKGNFGFNENRIIDKNDLPYAPDYSKAAGKPLGAQVNGVELTGDGYYTSVDDIHMNVGPVTPNRIVLGDYKFLDYNADGQITTLDKHPIKGNTYPPITYSLSSGFTYKGFDFNFMFQGNYGKYVEYFGSYDIEFRRDVLRVNISQLDYWTPNNPNAGHPTLHSSGSSSPMLNWGGGESDHYSIDILNHYWRVSNYLRLKEIYLGYNIKTGAQFAGISNILVYATANNVLTFTSLIEGDPERKSFADGYYPNFATYNLGLRFSF